MKMEDCDFEGLAKEILALPGASTIYAENRLRHHIADAFEDARHQRGMSVRQLATEMNTSVSQVQRLLQHDVGGSVTLRSVCRAAEVLGLAVSVHIREKVAHAGCVVPFGKVDGWHTERQSVETVVDVRRSVPTAAMAPRNDLASETWTESEAPAFRSVAAT